MALFKSVPEITLDVTGMHCSKCVTRVKEALEAVDGVMSAEVDLEGQRAVVRGSAEGEALIAAVQSCDFGARLA